MNIQPEATNLIDINENLAKWKASPVSIQLKKMKEEATSHFEQFKTVYNTYFSNALDKKVLLK
jgi:hypothetical protein